MGLQVSFKLLFSEVSYCLDQSMVVSSNQVPDSAHFSQALVHPQHYFPSESTKPASTFASAIVSKPQEFLKYTLLYYSASHSILVAFSITVLVHKVSLI